MKPEIVNLLRPCPEACKEADFDMHIRQDTGGKHKIFLDCKHSNVCGMWREGYEKMRAEDALR